MRGGFARQDDLYENDRRLLAAEGGVACFPLTCGALALPANARVAQATPTWTPAGKYVLGDPSVELRCADGFRLENSPSTGAAACNATFFAACATGGAWSWGINASDVSMPSPPRCVPVGCGRGALDVCGNESCASEAGLDRAVVNSSSLLEEPVAVGGVQTVSCATGHRAADADAGFSQCSDPTRSRHPPSRFSAAAPTPRCGCPDETLNRSPAARQLHPHVRLLPLCGVGRLPPDRLPHRSRRRARRLDRCQRGEAPRTCARPGPPQCTPPRSAPLLSPPRTPQATAA